MPIVVNCECGKVLKVSTKRAGKRVRCLTCGTIVNVPVVEAPRDRHQRLETLVAERSAELSRRLDALRRRLNALIALGAVALALFVLSAGGLLVWWWRGWSH